MTDTNAVQQNLVRLTPEQIKQYTSLGLAGDLLERALGYSLGNLHQVLIQIADSGLLDSIGELTRKARDLSNQAEALQLKTWSFYPQSTRGCGFHFLRGSDVDLLQEVEFYRQEQFWLNEARLSLVLSEDFIESLFKLYRDVEFFMRTVDALNLDDEPERQQGAPICPPNRYVMDAISHGRAA